MRYFLYKKLDSMGAGGAYHWLTTQATKDRMFNAFRDIVESNHSAIHSKILVEEMKIIVREPDGFLGASGRSKDDCTVASSLAAVQYRQYFDVKLKQMKVTWADEMHTRKLSAEIGREPNAQEATLSRTIGNFMQTAGIPYGARQ